MNNEPAKAGVELLKRLKTRLQEKDVTLQSLNVYRANATDEFRGLLNGTRGPTIGNLAAVAESVWGLVQNPHKASCQKVAVEEFWGLFSNDVLTVMPSHLNRKIDQEMLKNAFYWAFGLPNLLEKPPALRRLSAILDLQVWHPDQHDFVSIRESKARPLRGGDGVRVETRIEFGSDAHIYLVWLTLDARQRLHAPFYPWNGQWDQFDPARDILRASLTVPENLQTTWPMNAVLGLETIVLLLRREPLTEELRKELPSAFEDVLKSVKTKPNFEKGDLLQEFVHGGGKPAGSQTRAPKFVTSPINDAVYELNSALSDRLGTHFNLIRTLTVINVGKAKSR